MDTIINLIEFKYVVAAILYSFIGLVIFTVAFFIFEIATPKIGIWRELVEKQNIAVAIFLGAIIIGISTIIASAIHG